MLNPLIPLPIKTIEKDIRLCICNDGHELFAYQKNALMTGRVSFQDLHTNDQCQPLDLVTFALFKRK